jgi:alpha-tubulin suppressor-like RCC1 family protein
MNCRFFNVGKRWALVLLTLLGVMFAACGGGGGGGSIPETAPAAPANLQATGISSTSIILNWVDASNNEDGFKVFQGTDNSNVTTLVATLGAGTTNHSATGLTASTTYYYRVTAFNTGGDSAASNTANATTGPPPPATPANLQATAASSTAINLTWVDASINEDGFKVFQGTDNSNVTTLVATLGAGITSYSNTGLTPSTTNHYRVLAFNSGGESALSNLASATTQPPPGTVPTQPSNLQATVVSSTVINLTWTDASNNEAGFRVSRGTGASPASFTQIGGDLGEGVTTFTDTSAIASTTFVYRVLAFNAAGESLPAVSAPVTTPVPPVTPLVPTSVEGGNRHSLALMSDGTARAWGSNIEGGLGIGPSAGNSLIPVPVVGLTGVSAISAGDGHSLALMNNGTVKGWGQNFFGGVGSGDNVAHFTPVDVLGFTDVSDISAGGFFSIAVKNDGTVWAWGSGLFGQLGNGTINISSFSPVQVVGLTGVQAISAGQNHSLVRKNDGTVWAWGSNDAGQLGNDGTFDSPVPVQVVGLTGVAAVSAGEFHSLALLNDGTVRAWGSNVFGELGDGTTTQRQTPIQVAGLTGVAAISAGGQFSVALKNDGTVWAWGSGAGGQIGDGTTTNRLTPVRVTGLDNVQVISAAKDHSLSLRNATAVWAWGNNAFGQIGDNTIINRLVPVPAAGF